MFCYYTSSCFLFLLRNLFNPWFSSRNSSEISVVHICMLMDIKFVCFGIQPYGKISVILFLYILKFYVRYIFHGSRFVSPLTIYQPWAEVVVILEGKWCVCILLWSTRVGYIVRHGSVRLLIAINGTASLFRFQLYLFDWAETHISVPVI